MHHKSRSRTRPERAQKLLRREALKGLGALVITTPALGCSKDADRAAGTTDGVAQPDAPAGAAGATRVAGSPARTEVSGATGGTLSSAGTQAGAGGARAPSAAASGASGSAVQPRSASPAASGSGAAGAAGAAGADDRRGVVAGSMAADSGNESFVPVDFDSVATCALTPTDPAGEGPFFIHEDEVMNDDALMRVDMRGGKPGVELQLNLRVLDSTSKCMTPISGVQVYTWHTDASGFYSGFNGQNPDQTYAGGSERTVENMERFCRGIQITDSEGIVRFKTIYPGWYNGRAIHIHFVALRPGSGPDTMSYRNSKYMVFTTQMYFAEQFSRMIHEHNPPYSARASGAGYEKYVKPQNTTVNPTMRMAGAIAVGALNIVTAASGSRR
jgi:protocatechuate 3,4-dioxygenase beta subunit